MILPHDSLAKIAKKNRFMILGSHNRPITSRILALSSAGNEIAVKAAINDNGFRIYTAERQRRAS